MNNLSADYERILEVLVTISDENILPYQRRVPQLKALELICLVLTAEFMGIDSENHVFRQIPGTKNVRQNEVFIIVINAGQLLRLMICK